MICRDIWALHLSLLRDPPPAEPYFHTQGQGESKGNDSGSGSGNGSEKQKGKAVATPESDTEPDPKDDSEKDSSSSSSSSSSSEDGDDDGDPELASLLRENSEMSSSSDEEGEEDGPSAPAAKRREKRQGSDTYEGMSSTVAVLMLGCWTMRIPVLYLDFARCAPVHWSIFFWVGHRSMLIHGNFVFNLGSSSRMNCRTWILCGCYRRTWCCISRNITYKLCLRP